MEIKSRFIAQQDPPKHWQEELERVVPRRGDLSYLKIVWEPGEWWEPVQRWVIYQMMPLGDNPADDLFKPMLEGPNPRKFGYYDRVAGRFIRESGAPMISMQQWRLYHETGRLGMPYWVIQGDRGGHRYDFTRTEKLIIARKTGQRDVSAPMMGDLPYAPFDNRVRDKLANLDRLRKDEFAVAFMYQNPQMFDTEEERILQKAEEELWGWLESQIDDRLRNLPYGYVSEMAGLDAPTRVFVP